MCDAGYDACFMAEPFDPAIRRVQDFTREELDGDGPIEPGIARAVDLSHSSGTERCEDLERAEADAGSESQGRWPAKRKC
jgi:hypothetical protein